ncbi:MAG TPA: glycosyltransferase family 39 protein, partial [Armatimonadota bacterium]|nr:glycosyltransferase family 39 protein [Armatimonadota bacterium]
MKQKFFVGILTALAVCSLFIWLIAQAIVLRPAYENGMLMGLLGLARTYLFILLIALFAFDALRGRLQRKATAEDAGIPAETCQTDTAAQPCRISQRAQVVLVSLVLLVLLLVRAFATSPFICDEGIWNYVANAWLHLGLPPYTGALENKAPGIFYLFGLSNVLFGLNFWFTRVLADVLMVLTGVLLYAIAKRLRGHNTAMLTYVLYGLTSSTDVMAGQLPSETETFMLTFTVLAAYGIIKAMDAGTKKRYIWTMFLAGASLGCAITFKQIAILSCFGLFLFYLSLNMPYRKGFGTIIRDCSLIVCGLLAVTAVSVIPVLLSHVKLAAYLDGAWLILLEPGSSAANPHMRFVRLMG